MLGEAAHRHHPDRPRPGAAEPRRRQRAGASSIWCWRWARRASRYSGWGCLTGQGNGQGGREHGQKADQLPGYRMLADPAHRADVAAVWGVDPETLPPPGLPAMRAAGQRWAAGRRRGAAGVGVQHRWSRRPTPARSARAARGARPAGGRRPVPVRDRGIADVVLPIAQWAEEEGTMTNLEGRVLLRRRAQAAAGRRVDGRRRSSRRWPIGWARGDIFHADPRRRSSRSCAGPARAAWPTMPA